MRIVEFSELVQHFARLKMSDNELVDELIEHARNLEDSGGGVNPFLVHEHELLMRAAERLNQLRTGISPPP
jgi:hypothetical protein